MGENASYLGQTVKIGTCEDMLYLRADQALLVQAVANSVDPIRDAAGCRFRFPFPDEDATGPGEFADPFRAVAAWGVSPPDDLEHGHVQFVAQVGYNVCLPCPESQEGRDYPARIHRNGFRGAVLISQQRVWDGHLALVCECGGCGAKYRCPELDDAQDVIDALRHDADTRRAGNRWFREGKTSDPGTFFETIADRIVAGYSDPPEWVARPQIDSCGVVS